MIGNNIGSFRIGFGQKTTATLSKTRPVLAQPKHGLAPFYEKVLAETLNGKLSWSLQKKAPAEIIDYDGQKRVVSGDVALAVDPVLMRPDGTGQHYMYTFWLSKEAPNALMIKGQKQEDKYGHWMTQTEMGAAAYQALKLAIEQSGIKTA